MNEADNLKLWRSVEKTDPKYTKAFQKGGGFKGTSVNAQWLIYRATEAWGPMGVTWGPRIVSQQVIDGAPLLGATGQILGYEKLHVVQIVLQTPGSMDDSPGVPAFGQTILCGRNKNGIYTDEDAPKKSLTDAITKALSWLGFAADIHMGRYDDNKYVNQVTAEFAQRSNSRQAPPPTKPDGEIDMPDNNSPPWGDEIQDYKDWLEGEPAMGAVNSEAEVAVSKLGDSARKAVGKMFLAYGLKHGWVYDKATKKFKEPANVTA